MLQELVIHDFAIIESLSLSFDAGMTALTGETGAGKSIIIDAVGLLAGGRGSTDFIRTGAAKASLEGLFDATTNPRTNEQLAAFGLDTDDETVLLQRDLYPNGRNVCRVNGRLVNTSTLRAIGETLVDIHGQNEHQQLMHPETHLGLLDQFADGAVHQQLTTYQAAYTAYQQAKKTLQTKQANEQEWAQRLDMLQFQVGEIDAADLQADEDVTLTQERDQLANFQRVSDALQTSYELLDSEDFSPIDAIGNAMESIQGIAQFNPDYAAIATALQSAYYGLQEAQGDLSRQMDQLAWDPERLDVIEKRLDLITQLKRKYGDQVSDIIAYGAKAHAELAQMQANEAGEGDLETQVNQLRQDLLTVGQQLSQARHKAALALQNAVHDQLKSLYMEKTVFEVHFEQKQVIRPDGLDTLEFYIQANPGEAAKPLAKVASGGELSRLMLALKTIFAQTDGVTSIIFDEVDTGVSGRVAQAIANKISLIAQHSQVLCITHLPQVAAMSDHEYLIQKQVHSGRTTTSVDKLSAKARVDEIARMLAGSEVTTLTREHAEELLAMAAKTRQSLAAQ
ncbi:DNA repair protein RecN [Lacticaseibacillus brantae]|uniref:DNA repair protein RecN n=1 Tax=Lacticaseibacillus brantae DSM 23927 TaxID=1423727 RepID=A0A0R2AZX0_9LACO|nr:DNA repair protein RecN [Lacticaseibacillus brantae]KRM72814.1 DNA repair protein RecN [Lacticaseibacillus brantae DSM 23927]